MAESETESRLQDIEKKLNELAISLVIPQTYGLKTMLNIKPEPVIRQSKLNIQPQIFKNQRRQAASDRNVR